MQVIILAAGIGKRLYELTENNTKGMVKVNGVTLIERMLRLVDKKSFSKIIIVTGYKSEELIQFVNGLDINTTIEYINNGDFEKTNNIYSLYLTRDYLCQEDTLIMDSDIIFEEDILDLAISSPKENIAIVDLYKNWMTGMGVHIDKNNKITSFVNENEIDYTNLKKCYKTVGIYYFTKEFLCNYYIPFLEVYIKCFGNNSKYEQVLKVLSYIDSVRVYAKIINDKIWYEINDIQDVDLASTLFSSDEEQIVEAMLGRWGGYWRYPDYLDYFYLVTPYYPTRNMIEEIKASFEDLLVQYPSGMKVNALLAAKEFGVRPDNIIVGNGAAELIKSIMATLNGKTGFIRPTFEEYANRYNNGEKIIFYVDNPDFTYTHEDVITFFENNQVDNLVLVNPDNPSGNYINKSDMIKIIEWTAKNDIKLIVDESFVDFVDEPNPTLIEQSIIDRYTNLYVIKSISKSYGVPGLRLGVLASGDKKCIAEMKKDVSIWNINSFAEFYMQIAGKYREDYYNALSMFRKERECFAEMLSEIPQVRVIPSQANYIMIELLGGVNAETLKKQMLMNKKIFIKTLNNKIKGDGQFLRLAVRNHEDNLTFIKALKDVLA